MKDLTLFLTPSAPIIFSCSLISNSALTQQKSYIQRKIPLSLLPIPANFKNQSSRFHSAYLQLVSPKQVSLWSFEKLHYSLSLDSPQLLFKNIAASVQTQRTLLMFKVFLFFKCLILWFQFYICVFSELEDKKQKISLLFMVHGQQFFFMK